MPQGLRPDPANFNSWQEWAAAEAKWNDERLQEELNNFRQIEKWHKVGDPGEPSFLNGWTGDPATGGFYFYKDPFGMVYFQGNLINNALPSGFHGIFTLPVGYRPILQPVTYNTGITIGGVVSAVTLLVSTAGLMTWAGPSSGAVNGLPMPAAFRAHGILS